MRIGIISDSHDRADRVKLAVARLTDAGAEYFIHCGDLCNQAVLDQLAGLDAAFVWGNNDFEKPLLTRYANSLGIRVLGEYGLLELGGKNIAITHGHRMQFIQQALSDTKVDYLLLGHTHVVRDERYRQIRIINPGALQRAPIKTVALLDTADDSLKILTIEKA